ncbi:MAG TPA: nitroreductase family deazaflavin-dependent oxidoreductase [Ktedonobacterales bacterium]
MSYPTIPEEWMRDMSDWNRRTDMSDWNRRTIEEFRANKGQVGGMWEGKPLLLLTTTGAKSGQQHTTPVMYLREGDHIYIFASKGGAPTNPAWYHNLLAHPEVRVELGDQTYTAVATPVSGEERDHIYTRWAERYPQFREYQTKTSRVIPVIELERRSA